MDTQSLNGKWKFREAAGADDFDALSGEWMPASVPGCVHTDLLAASRIPDPFYRLNTAQVEWVAERDWLYAREFDVDAALLSHDRVELVCGGLDTFATVHLNGTELARTENAFIEHVFNVTGRLREGRNVLAVRFDSALRTCAEREKKHGSCPGGPRVYARKPQFSFGWDWAPPLPTCGLWRDVSLRAFDHGRIDSVHVRTELAERLGTVRLAVALDRTSDAPLTVNVALSKGDRIVAQAELREVAETAEARLDVDRPELWWPAGCGDPDLYDLSVRLRKKGTELDRREIRIGFRTVEIEREPDDEGESFILKINGRRVFCKGANWVPADSFPHRVTPAKYRRLLEMATDQNGNMLRVWGGGFYEPDVFYDLCDELGLMVWQDFMFACGDYPDLDEFRDEVRREAESVVKRLRHHPSLVLWCGNNENHMGHDNWGWPEHFASERLYHEVLPDACRRLDPDRPYWPGSPYGGDNSNSETHGDMHNWIVWHRDRDYRRYLDCRARFVSEFGFQSFPTTDTLLAFAEPEDLSMTAEVIASRQRCHDGNERLMEAVRLFYPEPEHFDRTVLFTQMVQADALRLAIEHWRRLKWHTAGTLYWQFNDCWPAISWATIDASLRPKPAHYAVRRAFAPVLLTTHQEGDDIVVTGINDTAQAVSGTLDIEQLDLRGRADLIRSGRVTLPADAAVELHRIPLSDLDDLDPRRHYLWLTFYSGIYSANTTHFFTEWKHVAAVEPDLALEVQKDEYDGQVTVRLTAPTFVKGVWLSVPGTDVRFRDNAFDLLPYVTRELPVDFGEGPPVEDLRAALRIQHCNPLGRRDT